MSSLGFMVGLLVLAAATPPERETIEILLVGPEGARKQMEDALRPLLSAEPRLRWVEQESLPPDGALPGTEGDAFARVWVDVSLPSQLCLYLPSAEAKGAMRVRTLARTAGAEMDDDLLARETLAQMVKAAVLALRGPLTPHTEAVAQSGADADRRSWPTPRLRPWFFARTQAGLGHLSASEAYEQVTNSYAKFGLAFNLSLGFAPTQNLILYGEFAMTAVRNANEDETLPSTRPYSRGNLLLVSVGPGVTYYLPGNYHVSGTLGYAKLWFLDDGLNRRRPPPTDMGIAGSLGVGKAWMLSPSWGLGLEARLGYALLKHSFRVEWAPVYAEAYRPTIHATTYALLLSATY